MLTRIGEQPIKRIEDLLPDRGHHTIRLSKKRELKRRNDGHHPARDKSAVNGRKRNGYRRVILRVAHIYTVSCCGADQSG